jgi:hypothetical protein
MNRQAREDFERFFEKLRQQRDELRLKFHLAKAGAEDEWEELEKKWEKLKAKNRELQRAAAETADELEKIVTKLGREIKKGYERIRQHL